MGSIPLPCIPYELLRPIFENLAHDNPSLCAISLCSSTFSREAQNILFRSVTIPITNTALFKFFLTVATSPHRLALIVRTLRISISGTLDDIWIAIPNGLKAMRNLKSLSVFVYASFKGPASILDGCTFQLEHFDWYGDPYDCRRLWEKFLPGQVDLKHLCMRSTPRLPSEVWIYPIIESASCPHLVSLEGTWSMLKAMLPNRKIETLVVSYDLGDTVDDNDVLSMSPTLHHVKVLHYSFPTTNPPAPDPFLLQCTSLTMLVLASHTNIREEALRSVLLRMPLLHTLILSFNSGENRVEEYRELALRLFQRYSVNIQWIYIQVDMMEYAQYRNVGEVAVPTFISASEVRKLWVPY